MIKISGKSGKSIIADAIQKYNGAVIYSYYDELLPFENGYHVDSGKYSVEEFCEGITTEIKEEVERNEGSPLNMVIIYTSVSDVSEIGTLYAYAERLEEVEKLVGTVVVMTR